MLKNEVPDENLLGTGIYFFKKLVKPRIVPQIVKKRIDLRIRHALVMQLEPAVKPFYGLIVFAPHRVRICNLGRPAVRVVETYQFFHRRVGLVVVAERMKRHCPSIVRKAIKRLGIEFGQGLLVVSGQQQRLANRGVYGSRVRIYRQYFAKGLHRFIILPCDPQRVSEPPVGLAREWVEPDSFARNFHPHLVIALQRFQIGRNGALSYCRVPG